MNKKLLLNLTNGVLLVGFCNMEKAVGTVSPLLGKSSSEATQKVVQVICNKHVLDAYESSDCYSHYLWQFMTNLTKKIKTENGWKGSKGEKNLVHYLAEMYKTADQNTKDAIALYFFDISGHCANKLADGDDEDNEQEIIDFVCECLLFVEE
jgi:hypothetical protein